MVNSRVEQAFLDQLQTIFASLQPEEVEQFYAAYRQWLLQQRIVELRQRLAVLQEQIGENELRIQQYRPPPIALASIARLQANGVSDIDLLDQMLERGETWLDTTMQHLDYFEQFENFLSDDYTQWCRRALEGAFEWMDSLLTAGVAPSTVSATADGETASSEDAGETEAKLLQKLASEADDDQPAGEEPTLKQIAVNLPAPDDAQLQQVAVDDAPLEMNEAEAGEEKEMVPDETPADDETITASEALAGDEAIRANEVPPEHEEIAAGETTTGEEDMSPGEPAITGASAESTSDTEHEQAVLAELTVVEHAETNGASAAAGEQPAVNGRVEQPSPTVAPITARRKRGVMRRLVGRLLGG